MAHAHSGNGIGYTDAHGPLVTARPPTQRTFFAGDPPPPAETALGWSLAARACCSCASGLWRAAWPVAHAPPPPAWRAHRRERAVPRARGRRAHNVRQRMRRGSGTHQLLDGHVQQLLLVQQLVSALQLPHQTLGLNCSAPAAGGASTVRLRAQRTGQPGRARMGSDVPATSASSAAS